MNTVESLMWILHRGIDWTIGLAFIDALYDLLSVDMNWYSSTILSMLWGFCIVSSIKFRARWDTL